MPDTPLVSIITVNYNQAEVTCELLESIKGLTYRNFEVIIVDNGSSEDPTALVHRSLPEAKVILSKKNLGFAGGNNLGIKASKGDYLFLVNNDTELPADVIENLLSTFKAVPGLGLASPKIYYWNQDKVLQYAGFTEINPYTARNRTIGQFEKDHQQYDQLKPVPYAHGAAMMVRRDVIKKAGIMPELYFLYYEELDWCEQIRKAGFKIYFQPKAFIYHKESVSVGSLNPMKTYYLTRNRILFMRRNAGRFQLTLFTAFLIFITIPKNLALYLLKGQFTHLNAFLRGVFWHLNHRPETNKLTDVHVKAELKNI